MVLGTILGIITGLFFGEYCSVFAPWTAAYIMILKVTTIPYLICAIIHGIGQLHTGQALQILKKGLFFIALAWAINIVMIYLSVSLFPHRGGATMASFIEGSSASIDFASILIPENIFYALSNNVVPAIVVFGLVLGISLMHIREKGSFMTMMGSLVDALTRVTSWISRITPFGTFLIIANQVGTIQLDTIKQVSTYIIIYILIICLIVFWIFPRIVSSLTNIRSFRWVRDLFPILLLAYTTNVIIVCLPFIIELIKREIQQFRATDEQMQSQIQGTVSVVFNMPLGSLFITVFIFFIAIFYGSPLQATGQIQLFISAFLTSLGAVGLGAWINSLNFILDTLGLPTDAVNIYLTTLPFTAGFQSMLSAMEIASLSLMITLSCHKLMLPKIGRVLRKSLFTAAPIFLLVVAIKAYNPLPIIQNCTPSIYDIEFTSSQTIMAPEKQAIVGDPLERILRTKVLKVGFNPTVVPFCFTNAHGQISGYDIAFAQQLAQDLGCQLVLVPMEFGRLVEQLSQGEFDIGMSAVTMTEERLSQLYFTTPYSESENIFVVKETQKKEFSSPEATSGNDHMKIAVLKGSSYEALAKMYFSDQTIVSIENCDEFPASGAEALLLSETQAIAWVVLHPGYTIVHPCPALGIDTLSYAMPQGANLFLNYVNLWLELKKNDGFSNEQYNLWVLGKTQGANAIPPRWSILRNIFQW